MTLFVFLTLALCFLLLVVVLMYNTLVGRNLTVRTTNSIIRSSDNHLVAVIGVDHLIVVHTPDATLVVQAEDEEAVREIVNLIQEKGWDEYL